MQAHCQDLPHSHVLTLLRGDNGPEENGVAYQTNHKITRNKTQRELLMCGPANDLK